MAGFPISALTALKKHNLRMLQILLVTLGDDKEALDFGIDDSGKNYIFDFPYSLVVMVLNEIHFDYFTPASTQDVSHCYRKRQFFEKLFIKIQPTLGSF